MTDLDRSRKLERDGGDAIGIGRCQRRGYKCWVLVCNFLAVRESARPPGQALADRRFVLWVDIA